MRFSSYKVRFSERLKQECYFLIQITGKDPRSSSRGKLNQGCFVQEIKMIPGIFSRPNATIYCRVREALTRRQGVPASLYRSSGLSLCSLYSTFFLSGSTHCSSSRTLITKSMTTAFHCNALLGGVYVNGLISGCDSVLDFTKPALVYLKDKTFKGCLRGSGNLRRPQTSFGSLSFGSSTFDGNWRIRDSSLLHGSWLKSFSTSSSACPSAGAARAVSFDGSPPDEQLANSSFSPDKYVIMFFFFVLNSVSA